MITLITGAPGSGKTLYCIDKEIRPLIGTRVSGVDFNGQPAVYDRTVYTNINGLLLPHELIDEVWLHNLATNRQPGSVVVFDEVQRVWPNRPTGSKKPSAVEYLETHRHDGIDVILLTQNPQLLDPAVRALVGRHLHMRRLGSVGGAIVYEWDLCSGALNFKNAFRKTPYRYSKKVFELYKSAKIHTKQKRSLPFAVWVALAGVAAAAFMWPKFIGSITKGPQAPIASAASAPSAAASAPIDAASAPRLVNGVAVLSPQEYFDTFRPRMRGLPHTAARYDQITQAKRAPIPAACIRSDKQACKCWTQQGTPLVLPVPTCNSIVDGGLFLDFDPDGGSASSDVQAVHPNAFHWKTNGGPARGGWGYGGADPHVVAQTAHVPPDVITPGDIAKASKARTGGNVFARSSESAPAHAAAREPATRGGERSEP